MLKAQKEAGLMNKGAMGNPNGQGAKLVRSQGNTAQPTLADIGINKTLSSRATTGEITNYKPTESMQRMAYAEVAEKHYRQAKDLSGLRKAVEAKWKERHDFVTWWDKQGNKGGNPTMTGRTRLEDVQGSPNNKTVSRWRQKCSSDDDYGLFSYTPSGGVTTSLPGIDQAHITIETGMEGYTKRVVVLIA